MSLLRNTYVNYIKPLVTSPTAKNSIWLLASNFVTAALSVVALIIVSRSLGPEKFGIVATFNAIWLTIVTVTDFGLGTSAIKFISQHLVDDKRRAALFMRVIFEIDLLGGLLIGIAGLFFSSAIANMLGGPQLLMAVRLGFLAGLFVSAGAFMSPFMIAHNRFATLFVVTTTSSVFRIAGIIFLLATMTLNLDSVLWLYTAVPALLLVVAFFVSPKGYLKNPKWPERKAAYQQVFHFSKWIFLSTLAITAFGKLDIFILSRLKGSAAVGFFAAAIQLTNFFPLLMGALSNAALPRVSQLKTQTEFKRFIKKSTIGFGLIAFALVPFFFMSETIISLVFGDKFKDSIGVFKIIYPGFLLALVVSPWQLIFYATDKPKLLTYINYLQVGLLIVIDLLLIPTLGIRGAAFGFLISLVLGAFLTIIVVSRLLNRLPD